MISANIHSYESFATLDGEGIRFAVFFSGCANRCVYCHNPDTLMVGGGYEITLNELIKKVERGKNYYVNGGGVTASGGEPLMQAEFVTELFKETKSIGLTTCLDTSACVIPKKTEELLKYTDTVILDLKFYCEEDYLRYVGTSILNVLKFLDICERLGAKVWIRTVIIPGINDTEYNISKYLEIVKLYKCVFRYQLLGYHNLGEYKYEKLGMPYKLKGIQPLSLEKLESLQAFADSKFFENDNKIR